MGLFKNSLFFVLQFSPIWHNLFTASISKLPVLLKKVEKIFLDGTFLDVIRQIIYKTKKYTCKGVFNNDNDKNWSFINGSNISFWWVICN